MKYYVYIIQSQIDHRFYIGQTSDLSARLIRHNKGLEKYTKKFLPWLLFWSTNLDSRAEAMKLEIKLKNLKSTKRLLEYISKL